MIERQLKEDGRTWRDSRTFLSENHGDYFSAAFIIYQVFVPISDS